MTIKPDAWERIANNQEKMRKNGNAEWLERREVLMREQLSTEKGREFFYEYVSNAQALRMEAYTANATTYYLLGYQKWASELVESAKRTSLKLYHQMEIEALQREESRHE